jgi:hypothetical protein
MVPLLFLSPGNFAYVTEQCGPTIKHPWFGGQQVPKRLPFISAGFTKPVRDRAFLFLFGVGIIIVCCLSHRGVFLAMIVDRSEDRIGGTDGNPSV